MPPEERDPAYLWDMVQAGENVVAFVRGRTFDDYERDSLLRSAVERQIEIIGEAARRVTRAFQTAHPEVPWQKIVAQRHVLAHEYGEIINERIWRVATEHVPLMLERVRPLIPQIPDDPAQPAPPAKPDRPAGP